MWVFWMSRNKSDTVKRIGDSFFLFDSKSLKTLRVSGKWQKPPPSLVNDFLFYSKTKGSTESFE